MLLNYKEKLNELFDKYKEEFGYKDELPMNFIEK